MQDVERAIPHREPFLFVDRIIELDGDKIKTEKKLDPDLDFFRGHYPGYPIMPGVLTCEAVFQSGAILLSRHMESEKGKVPVLVRIKNAKFKRMIKPGETILIEAEITERVGGAFYLSGKASVNGELAVTVKFVCTLADYEGD